MLRLVFCSPKRKELGPDCMKDVRDHVVLAFRGNVMELKQSVMKGITGAYESQILFYPWSFIETEYTKNQLRSIESIPLKFSENQKKSLLFKALEMYWTYGGDYKFFSNNCATELLDLLVASSQNSRLGESMTISPNGLLKALRTAGLLDEASKKEIPSYQGKLQEAFSKIKNLAKPLYPSLPPNFKDEMLYMISTDAEYRMSLYEAIVSNPNKAELKKQIAAFYLLESYILSKEKEHFAKIKSGALVAARDGKLGPRKNEAGVSTNEDLKNYQELLRQAKKVDELIELRKALLPASRVSKGYGIPQHADLNELNSQSDEDKVKELGEKIQKAQKERDLFFAKYFKATASEVEQIQANLLVFLKKIMELGL
jgi:hypothetical protein